MKKTLLTGFILLLTSCMVGPNYHKPSVDTGETFVESSKGQRDQEEKQRKTLCKWWEQFNDPLLSSYIQEASEKNYDLKIAREKIQELRALYRMETAELFPKIDGTGQAKKIEISKNLFAPNRPTAEIKKLFQIGFDASWELDFFGKIRRSKQAALYTLQASSEEMRNVLITIMSETAKLYIDIRSFQNKIELTEKQISAQTSIYELIESKYESGIANLREVDEAKGNLEKTKASLPLLIAEMKKSQYSLAFLLSRRMDQIVGDFNSISSIPNASDKIPDFLPSDLIKRRPDIRQAERELAAQTSKIGVAKADLFPQFSLTGSFSWLSQKTSNWLTYDSRNWYVGPDLKWPLLYFGRIRSNIRMEKAKERQAFTNYEKTVLNAIKETESSLAEYFNQQQSQQNTNREVFSIKEQAELQKDLYQSGINDYTSWLSILSTQYEKEKNLIDSKANLATRLIALYKVLGGDWTCSDMP